LLVANVEESEKEGRWEGEVEGDEKLERVLPP